MTEFELINDLSSNTFKELFKRFQGFDLDVLKIYFIDSVVSSALPHLAQQFHIMGNEGWQQARNEKDKRELIKKAIELHRYRGTKYSLEKVLAVLETEVEIKEWFEYQGTPHCFMATIDLSKKGIDFEFVSKLEALIDEFKNVRSHLEKLQIFIEIPSEKLRLKSALISGDLVSIYPFQDPFIWDETNWDEAHLFDMEVDEIVLPTLFWDVQNWDEAELAFG